MARRYDMLNQSDVNAVQDKIKKYSTEDIVGFIVQQLKYVGEKAVKIARDKNRSNTWGDVTGNLRSSIGYVILVNGSKAAEGPEKTFSGPKGTGKDGPPKAEALINRLEGSVRQGIALIVVAGMEYAEYVEVIHHKDVLITSRQQAEATAERLLSKLFSKK